VAGLAAVPDDALDSARGMGFSPRQLLWRVEVPLALPVMIAGVRIATVSTIALVTVGALIGRGGVGQFILEGLRTLFQTEIMLGATLAVGLALMADGLLLLVQRRLTPWAGRERQRP
jgi:osmoprotectant transport system permease protein